MIEVLWGLIFSGLFLGSLYALLGVGMTFLFGVSSVINMAHGDMLMIGAYITGLMFNYLGIDPLISIILVACILGGFGAALYYAGGFANLLKRALPRANKELVTLILTFALTMICTNFIAGILTANPETYPYPLPTIEFGKIIIPLNKLYVILTSFSVIGGLWFVIKKTWFGIGIRCVLNDDVPARLVGVNIDRVYLSTFIVGIATAGIAGTLYSMSYRYNPYMGMTYTMAAFVAIIFGGVGSIRGALVGGLIVGMLESFITYFTAPLLKIAINYLLMIFVLLVKPKGLFKGV